MCRASQYHIEAAIVATAAVAAETSWHDVVQLYDALIAVAPSPVVALNRAVAIGQVEGPERGTDPSDQLILRIGSRSRQGVVPSSL